jgi:hypothetical protein
LGVELTTPPRLKKNIVTKSEEVKTGPVCQRRHWKGLKDLRVDLWKDGVDQDMRTLEVALDRDEWAKLLKKARAH